MQTNVGCRYHNHYSDSDGGRAGIGCSRANVLSSVFVCLGLQGEGPEEGRGKITEARGRFVGDSLAQQLRRSAADTGGGGGRVLSRRQALEYQQPFRARRGKPGEGTLACLVFGVRKIDPERRKRRFECVDRARDLIGVEVVISVSAAS
jgi:hypothetical protein